MSSSQGVDEEEEESRSNGERSPLDGDSDIGFKRGFKGVGGGGLKSSGRKRSAWVTGTRLRFVGGIKSALERWTQLGERRTADRVEGNPSPSPRPMEALPPELGNISDDASGSVIEVGPPGRDMDPRRDGGDEDCPAILVVAPRSGAEG